MDDDERSLEATIRTLVYRLNDAREGSAEYRMIERQLIGLRNSELGRLIIEDYEMSALVALPNWSA
jgi:hypothetical protein